MTDFLLFQFIHCDYLVNASQLLRHSPGDLQITGRMKAAVKGYRIDLLSRFFNGLRRCL